MASDVTPISKNFDEQTWQENQEANDSNIQIPYTDLKIYPSCSKLCEILLQQ